MSEIWIQPTGGALGADSNGRVGVKMEWDY